MFNYFVTTLLKAQNTQVIMKQGFVELYTQRLKDKNINANNLRTQKAKTT